MAGVTAKSEVRVQDQPTPLDPFIGRAAELARVAEVISRVEAGQPWLVAIEGDPGVGKTALARRCLAEAADLQVLSARADQAEADLDFGIVDQLLRATGGMVRTATPDGAPSSFSVGAELLQVVGEQQAAAALAIVIEDLQWADRKSVEALTFMLRRLSVDPVIAIVTYRGPSDRLDEAARRLLLSVENQLFIPLSGLNQEEIASLAAALRAGALDDEAAAWLYRHTGGHPLYLRTLLSEGFDFDPRASGRSALPRSLAAAIADQLHGLPSQTRVILEMLSVLNLRMPLAQVGQAAEIESPSAAIEPAGASGLVDWWPEEPICPVAIRHPLVRDAIYAGITITRRRMLHARAASFVSQAASWEHRIAALDRPDEDLAAQLEHLAGEEAAAGRLALAATHLQWASDISPERPGRERRLLTAALHLMLAEESRGLALRQAVEESALSPLRSCVLGTMAFSSGRAGRGGTLVQRSAGRGPERTGSRPLAAMIANRLAGTYTLLGDGEKVRALVCQASGDYLGMADALGHWQDAETLDGRSRAYAVLWWPLLVEGLVGSGQSAQAATALDRLRAIGSQVSYLRPTLAWLEGWRAEQRGAAEEALEIYGAGEAAAGPQSPVHTARLLLAHGRLLRRTGQRRLAVERLRRANDLYQVLRAAPFIARTEEELAACRLPGSPAKSQSVLALTSRETEVAHLVGKGMSNPEVAAELFISRKAVEYHLGNIYAKCGLRGRQELRRYVEQWHQPATV